MQPFQHKDPLLIVRFFGVNLQQTPAGLHKSFCLLQTVCNVNFVHVTTDQPVKGDVPAFLKPIP
jgi:hypothetical protein